MEKVNFTDPDTNESAGPRLTEAEESRKEIWIRSNLAWKMAKRLNFMY